MHRRDITWCFVKLHDELFTNSVNMGGFRCVGSDSRMRFESFGCVKWLLENKGSETRMENVNNRLEEIDYIHICRGVKRQDFFLLLFAFASRGCSTFRSSNCDSTGRFFLRALRVDLRRLNAADTYLFTSGTGRNNEVSSFLNPSAMNGVSVKCSGKGKFTEEHLKTL